MSEVVKVGQIWRGQNSMVLKEVRDIEPLGRVLFSTEYDEAKTAYSGSVVDFANDHILVRDVPHNGPLNEIPDRIIERAFNVATKMGVFKETEPNISRHINTNEVVEKLKEKAVAKRDRLDVMIDIESLSTAHNGATIQIAAVPFEIEGKKGQEEWAVFNRKISPKSCIEAGLDVNADTMKWWFNQDEHVQSEVIGQAIMYGTHLETALARLSEFLKDLEKLADKVFIWGYPATSDMTWLQQAYLATKLPYPVAYNRTRCLGTIADLYWELYCEKLSEQPKTQINHDALVDCQSQIEMVVHAYKKLKDRVSA